MSRGTQEHGWKPPPFAYWTITLCGGPFQGPSTKDTVCNFQEGFEPFLRHALQPPDDIGPEATESAEFRLFPFRSPLLRECLSVPRGT